METENTTTVEETNGSSVVQEIVFDFSTDYTLKNEVTLPEQEYKNTIRKNPHRRKITIYKQDANVMEVDIESYPPEETINEDGTPTEQDGTAIKAETFDAFHKVISQADANAKSSFNMTKEVADKVASYLEQSNQNVINLEQQIIQSQGTKVQVDGEYVTSFDANTKLDVTTFNNKEIIANVSYDSTTNTFNF